MEQSGVKNKNTKTYPRLWLDREEGVPGSRCKINEDMKLNERGFTFFEDYEMLMGRTEREGEKSYTKEREK